MEMLLELVLWLVVEVFGAILLELGLEAFKAASGRRSRHPALAAFGYLLFGAAAGAASVWLVPQHIFPRGRRPDLSVLVAPLVGGIVMHGWGEFRRARGHDTSNLATFYGGAALLLGYSLVRLLLAR